MEDGSWGQSGKRKAETEFQPRMDTDEHGSYRKDAKAKAECRKLKEAKRKLNFNHEIHESHEKIQIHCFGRDRVPCFEYFVYFVVNPAPIFHFQKAAGSFGHRGTETQSEDIQHLTAAIRGLIQWRNQNNVIRL